MRLPTAEQPYIFRHLHHFELTNRTSPKGISIKDFSYAGKLISAGQSGLELGRKVPFATVCLLRVPGYFDGTRLSMGVSLLNSDPDPETGRRDVFDRAVGRERAYDRALVSCVCQTTSDCGGYLGVFPPDQAARMQRAARKIAKAVDSFFMRPCLSRYEANGRLQKLMTDALVQAASDREDMFTPEQINDQLMDALKFCGFRVLTLDLGQGLSADDTSKKKE